MSYVPPEKIQALKKWMKSDGRWFDYFRHCLPELDEAMDEHPEHVPCPVHGGKDGFRLFKDAEETGGGICNSCGAFRDGIALTMFIKGCSFPEGFEMVEEWRLEQDDDDEDDEEPEDNVEKKAKPVEYNEYAIKRIDWVVKMAKSPHERLKRYFLYLLAAKRPPSIWAM